MVLITVRAGFQNGGQHRIYRESHRLVTTNKFSFVLFFMRMRMNGYRNTFNLTVSIFTDLTSQLLDLQLDWPPPQAPPLCHRNITTPYYDVASRRDSSIHRSAAKANKDRLNYSSNWRTMPQVAMPTATKRTIPDDWVLPHLQNSKLLTTWR